MSADNQLQKFTDKWGRVTMWPAKPFNQLTILRYLASKFVLGKRYSEAEMNDQLNQYHTFGDPALLRRELVIKGLFDRTADGRQYWKKDSDGR